MTEVLKDPEARTFSLGRTSIIRAALTNQMLTESVAVPEKVKSPVLYSLSDNKKDGNENFYEDLRARVANGRGYSDDELLAGLVGADKASSPRWGYIADRRRDESLATAYWRGPVADEDGYYTTGIVLKYRGKPAYIMAIFPQSALKDGSDTDVSEALKANKHIWSMNAFEELAGRWVASTDAIGPEGAYFDKLKRSGRIVEAGNGFHRLNLEGTGTSEFDLLREATRRLSLLLRGETPSVSFVRSTGANPGKGAAFSPERLEARFSRAATDNAGTFDPVNLYYNLTVTLGIDCVG